MPFQFNIGDHISLQAGFTNFDSAQYGQLKWSRNKLFKMVKNNPSCDAYFRSLPNSRTLTSMINDDSIWISYGPGIEAPFYGKAYFDNGEIGIADRAFRMGRWTVLATIIHELAHLNGAPGHGGDTRAEEAVYHCGLGTDKEYFDLVDDPRTRYNPNYGD
ncbi:hypothetical protein [Roseibium sp. MMSF_3544]|uniref:hypothetical protein n=1 Tax=unclassified Roseibium TaxID=2629323 RepID=UPI00273F76FC|nr:hypothetical protein [Roseibium sp. MMSF_3544]